MFCAKCGKQNPDGAKFCEGCGGVLEAAPNTGAPTGYAPASDMGGSTAPAGGGKNKIIAAIAAVVAVIVVIFGACSIFGSSPEDPVDYLIKAMEKGKVETLLKAFPKEMQTAAKEQSEAMEMFEEALDEVDMDDFKISHKVIDKDKLSKSEIKDLQESYDEFIEMAYESAGIDKDPKGKIKAAYELKVELEAEKDGETEETTQTFTVIKVGGKWYLSPNMFMSLF